MRLIQKVITQNFNNFGDLLTIIKKNNNNVIAQENESKHENIVLE